MLWQAIPQPNCIEEAVEFGDLESTCVASRSSDDKDGKIEWDHDDPNVGLMKGGNFESDPALQEGDPSQSSHVSAELPVVLPS